MNRVSFIALLLFALPASVCAQILNGDFEHWTSGRPDEWTPVDTMGKFLQGVDSTNNSACFFYADTNFGIGVYLTQILTNATPAHPYGSIIPDGRRVLTIHYRHNCGSQEGYIAVSYILRNESGTTYSVGGQLLGPSEWRSVQLVLPQSNYPVSADYAEVLFKFSFATQKYAIYSYKLSIDDVTLDSALDASAPQTIVASASPTVFPNPVSSKASVQTPLASDPELRATLIDVTGRDVLPASAIQRNDESGLSIDCSQLPDGFYCLRLASGQERSTVNLLVRH